jgi:hypothetical protein
MIIIGEKYPNRKKRRKKQKQKQKQKKGEKKGYDTLNPSPYFPMRVLSSFFSLLPSDVIFTKSLSENGASLYIKRARCCHCAIAGVNSPLDSLLGSR